MSAPTFASRAPVYRELWDSARINASKRSSVLATARKIASAKGRYEPVSAVTGVPWYVIGIIHAMECGIRFDQHLHNGDPLTARTRQVPRGRPKEGAPPFTWEASAIDALRYDKLDRVSDWPVERICYELEKYNGWGYLPKGIVSPYLWSYTNHYTSGKFVVDGVWDGEAVSAQAGAIALLKALIKNGDVTLDDRAGSSPARVPVVEASPSEIPNSSPKPSVIAVAAKSKSVWSLLNAQILIVVGFLTDLGGSAVDWVGDLFGVLPSAADGAISMAEKGSRLSELIGFDWKRVALAVVVVCLLVPLVRHVFDKVELVMLRRQQ